MKKNIFSKEKINNLFNSLFKIFLVLSIFSIIGCNYSFGNKEIQYKKYQTSPEIIGSTYVESADGKISIESVDGLKTDQEILISAIIDESLPAFPSQTYEWDFGDGSSANGVGVVSVLHTYQKPGTYTITLKITDLDQNIETYTANITVIGRAIKLAPRAANPILELKFEENNSLGDTSGNNLNAEWGQSGTAEFVEGVEGRALHLSNKKYIKVNDTTGKLSGLSSYTISFWFKHDTAQTYPKNSTFLEKYDSDINKMVFAAVRYDLGGLQAHLTTDQESQHSSYWNMPDDKWHQFVITYDSTLENSNLKIYFDQRLISIANNGDHSPLPLTMKGTMISSNAPLYIGASQTLHEDYFFDGCIDELKIYDRALSKDELFLGFDVIHANFHAHTSQYILVKVPGEIRANHENRIEAELTGGDLWFSKTLNDSSKTLELVSNSETNNLKAEERILLRNKNIDGSENPYVLTVRLVSPDGTVLDEKNETFYKTYDGIPEVGIDENNSIRLKVDDPNYPDGKLFFPVTPYSLNDADIINWQEKNYINTLHSQGFWPDGITLADWNRYINISDTIKAIGPGAWEGEGNTMEKRSANYYNLEEYVNTFKGHNAMLTWHWMDEPDLYDVSPLAVRSWTYRCHKLDPHHPVSTNLSGMYYAEEDYSYGYNKRSMYNAISNKNIFGKNSFVADIYGFDYYALDWAKPGYEGGSSSMKNASFEKLGFALDNMREENYNLVPYFSFVETCEVDAAAETPWTPTPEQLKMLIWINVVHGAKGINWFHYFGDTPSENFEVLANFTKQITELTPVVLGAAGERTVEVTATGGPQGNGVVHTMLREYNGKVYLFAVRISEMEKNANPAYTSELNPEGYPDPVQNYPVTANFKVSGFSNKEVVVIPYKENRGYLDGIQNGTFSDTFKPYEVHIYTISEKGNKTPDAPTNLISQVNAYNSVTLEWKDNSNDEYEFIIERSVNNSDYYEVGRVSSDVTLFVDDSVLGNTKYFYRVKAHNTVGDSLSTVVTVNTPAFAMKVEAETLNKEKSSDVVVMDYSYIAFVGFIKENDQMVYDVNILQGGEYTIDYNIAVGEMKPGEIKFMVNGNMLTATIIPAATEESRDWESFYELKGSSVITLEEGLQEITLEASGENFNIDWFKLTLQ